VYHNFERPLVRELYNISLNSISNHIPLDHISLYTCNSLLRSGIFEIGQEIIEILDEV
jgi:hypothetical protein